VLIPNTGFEHRVGPNRLHVQTARALSAAGFCVLRFDVSGLGDSDAPRHRSASSVEDCKMALDALDARRLGKNYVVIGVCSGSHDGHRLCRDDARVIGLFSVDGYCFRTPRFKRLFWFTRLLHPLRSAQNIAGRFHPRFRLAEPQGLGTETAVWPEREEVARDYQQFLERQVNLGFLFTGDIQDYYLYAEQHYDVFPIIRGWAPVWFLPHIDHTLTRRAAREEMIAHIRKWLLSLSS
jgi:pimeloyl-ACP methyl ester carboxylesterase